jgi:hypothetical protein
VQPLSPESRFKMVANEESGPDGGDGDLYLYMYWRRLGASLNGSVWILFVVAVCTGNVVIARLFTILSYLCYGSL